MIDTRRVDFGKCAEDRACESLVERGYAILARRYRTRAGEIDIVARDGATVVFVEVKARTDLACGHPAESVTWRKQRRVAAMAADYLTRHKLWQAPCRFDVVAITGGAGEPQRVEVIREAFWIDV